MQFTLQNAQEHLSELLTAADRGHKVEIARSEMPEVKLVFVPSVARPTANGQRVLGAGVGQMIVPSWEEWKAMDAEIEREMNDAPLVTTGEI